MLRAILLESVRATAPPIGARISCPKGAGRFSACSTIRSIVSSESSLSQSTLKYSRMPSRVPGVEHLLHRGVGHRLDDVDQRVGRLAQLRGSLLAVLDRPDVDEHEPIAGLPRTSSGMNGSGGAVNSAAPPPTSSGALSMKSR